MQDLRISITAGLAAITRAAHQKLDAEPKILADPVSLKLAELLNKHGAPAALSGLPKSILEVGRSAIVLRSRYAEDTLAASYQQGCRQFVVLGAGLDTFAYRQPSWARDLRIFEIDRPEMLEVKRGILAEAGITEPPNLVRLAANLERDALDSVLRGSGFDRDASSLVSMLGVAQYLSRENLEYQLRAVARSVPGTLLVMTFLIPPERLAGPDLKLARLFAAFTEAIEEPVVSVFEPDDLQQWLPQLGFREVQLFTPRDAAERYFAGRTDSLRAPEMEWILRATV